MNAYDIPHLDTLLRNARGHTRAWEAVRSLCDDVGPRFSGTAGYDAGVTWSREAMNRAGLSEVHTEPAPATLWSRGSASATLRLPRRQPVVLTALGGSVATPEGGLDAPVVAFPSLDALDAAPRERVAGNVVYVHHVMPRLRDGTGYNAASWVRTAGPSNAARKGAVGFLVRSASTSTTRVPHTGALHYEPDVPKIPAAALSVPDAELLYRAVTGGAAVHCELALGCSPLPEGESDNVLGELPGTDRAWEIVLLGAHLDSWDVGTGALDDAAGCAIALETSHMIAALPARPRRTVRIVFFGNEELGSGGGRGYADRHRDEAPRHAVAMEADQGDGRPWALRVPQDRRDSRAARVLHASLEPLGIALDHGPARGGVDILPLRALGVPFVDLRQDATTYFDCHHSASDVLEAVSCEALEACTVSFAAAVWVLANMDDSFAGR